MFIVRSEECCFEIGEEFIVGVGVIIFILIAVVVVGK